MRTADNRGYNFVIDYIIANLINSHLYCSYVLQPNDRTSSFIEVD